MLVGEEVSKFFRSSSLSKFYLMVRLEAQKWDAKELAKIRQVLIEKQIRYLSQRKKKENIFGK